MLIKKLQEIISDEHLQQVLIGQPFTLDSEQDVGAKTAC